MSAAAEDRQALADLLATYAATIDDRDLERYRDCFEPDVECVGFGPEPIRGVDAWLDFVREQLAGYRSTQHLLGPQLAEIRADVAELRTDLQATHLLREPRGAIFTLFGTYRSRAVRKDGIWRLARHELIVRATEKSER